MPIFTPREKRPAIRWKVVALAAAALLAFGAAFAQVHAAGAEQPHQDIGRELALMRWNAAFRPRNDFAETLHQRSARARIMRLVELERLDCFRMIRCGHRASE